MLETVMIVILVLTSGHRVLLCFRNNIQGAKEIIKLNMLLFMKKDKTKVKSVQLEKTFGFKIRYQPSGAGGTR